MMPIMFGVFSFMYTASFSLYLIVSTVFSTFSTMIINKIVEKSFEKKIDFIDKMSNEEVGEILESSLYCQSGDIRDYFNDFLDEHDDVMTDKFNEFYGE